MERCVRAAATAGIPLEVCGEAASEPTLLLLLVGLGVTEVSVGAARVGQVRAWVRDLSAETAAEAARRALEATSAGAVAELAAGLLDEAGEAAGERVKRLGGVVAVGRERRSVVPALAPSASTASRLLASASRPFTATRMADWKPMAERTKCAAGRAWRSTPAGRATSVSELAGTPGLLRGTGHVGERRARRGGDRGRDRALHDRGVREDDVAVGLTLEHGADGEDRAAQIAEDDHALAGLGARDGGVHAVPVGAQGAVRAAADSLDAHVGPGHLAGECDQAAGELRAVRYHYEADHRAPLSVRPG